MDPANTVVRDGMNIDFDVPIEMDDGLLLRADVFRPLGDGPYPVLMTMGPYGKGLSFQEAYTFNWDRLIESYPEVAEGSSNKYQSWETVDPEKWVPEGYVCVRVDSRGAGRSPGILDAWSPRETKDFHDCIEWAGTQPWSNGKVGLSGISYYAMNQWHVASLQPPHLTAMLVQEGAADYYRDVSRHGGILSGFLDTWYHGLVTRVQHGRGEHGFRSVVTGETVSGPETLEADELAANRVDSYQAALDRPLDGAYYRERSPDYAKIITPLLSTGNWGGQGLHPRGNTEGFLAAASEQKWLEMHGDTHSSPFYTDYGRALQRRFFGHFLKDEDTGWTKQPRVALRVRHVGEVFVDRAEHEWPLARTQWTPFYLNPNDSSLTTDFTAGPTRSYDTTSDGITFLTTPLHEDTEITGPVAAKLFISSDTTDADLFVCLRAFAPDGTEVTFQGSNDPRTPVGLGWLRASHRKLDPDRSLPYRPYHTHDEQWPLTPHEPVEVDVEIWPTCLVVPAGYRIGLTVRGRDYENAGTVLPNQRYPLTGVGPFLHNNPQDRPSEIFGGTTTLHFTDDQRAFLLLPLIPGGDRCMIADLHCHYFPLEHVRTLADSPIVGSISGDQVTLTVQGHDLMLPIALVSAERQSEHAAARRIDRQVLSLPPFAVLYELPAAAGIEWGRRINDGLADAAAHADRLGAFATVPLQAGGAVAARELNYAITELGMDGVEILTSIDGRPIDTPDLEEFWAAAEQLSVPVFIHPHFVSGADRMRQFHLRNVIGNPIEVALTGAQLMLGGLTERHPSLSIVLAHGGGALPSLAGRLQHAFEHRAEYAAAPSAPRDGLRGFHYDTVVFDHRVLRHLGEIVGFDRLVLGSDFPFDMGDDDPVSFVEASDLDDHVVSLILRGGAGLLPASASATATIHHNLAPMEGPPDAAA